MIWIFCVALVTSGIITRILRGYALRYGLLDQPNKRSSHSVATPRGGGLAIVLTFLGAIIILVFSGELDIQQVMTYLLAGGMVAGIGYWDDHGHIPARFRILIHFTAAGLAVFWLGGFPVVQFGEHVLTFGWIGNLFGVVLLVWLLNLYNFMDGIDGVAGAEAIFVAGGAGLISLTFVESGNGNGGQLPLLLLQFIFVAATIGFLIWNWPPSKIFMGDVGSGFIGFILGVFAFSSAATGLLSIWSWLILLGVFLVDTTVTLVRRFISRKRWYEAHSSHAYQHLTRRWHSHKKVTLTILVIDLVWLLPLAWAAALNPAMGWWITLLSMMPLVVLAIILNAGIEDYGSAG